VSVRAPAAVAASTSRLKTFFSFVFFFTLRVHFSKSGRLERLLPVAEEHAFVLKSMGLLHAPKR
jgi:hypothetical protein